MNEGSPETNSTNATSTVGNTPSPGDGNSLSDRYGEVMGKVNQSLDQVDWSQMGKYGKAVGIVAIVITDGIASLDFNCFSFSWTTHQESNANP